MKYKIAYKHVGDATGHGQTPCDALYALLKELPYNTEILRISVNKGGTAKARYLVMVEKEIESSTQKAALREFLYTYELPDSLDLENLSISQSTSTTPEEEEK